MLYYKKGLLELAASAFECSISLKPDDISVRLLYGEVQEIRNLLEITLEQYLRAHSLASNDIATKERINSRLYALYTKLGQIEFAQVYSPQTLQTNK
jgi:hypothetical protein